MGNPKSNSQNPPMNRLQTVTNIGQSSTKQDRHGIGHVGLSSLLVKLSGDNPLNPSISLLEIERDTNTPIDVLPFTLIPPFRLERLRTAGRNGGEEAELRQVEEARRTEKEAVVVTAEEMGAGGGGEGHSRRGEEII
uniref:Uncharacterized protein n=2 Tax=Opuntia streptacantha TaxID=393608 RepID=A0A7C9E0W2_OPUST